MTEYKWVGIGALMGLTLTSIEVSSVKDEIVFKTDGGRVFRMFHEQDCCEDVLVDDITGDLQDLLGEPLLLCEESTNCIENPPGVEKSYQDSFTWTFYKLATRKGYVDIRWYGESNGYYSESVSIDELIKQEEV